LTSAGIEYAGWLPNHHVPRVFSRFRLTVHVPRRPYATALPGIPTIRPFEAMACGIPLICAPWDDVENLFQPGRDYLVARDGRQMKRHMRNLLHNESWARELAHHGRRTILSRHTCAHRVDELFGICRSLGLRTAASCIDVPPPVQVGSVEELTGNLDALTQTP
jgi:spore maturation protein CgeB